MGGCGGDLIVVFSTIIHIINSPVVMDAEEVIIWRGGLVFDREVGCAQVDGGLNSAQKLSVFGDVPVCQEHGEITVKILQIIQSKATDFPEDYYGEEGKMRKKNYGEQQCWGFVS